LRVEKVEGEVGGSFSGVRYAAAFVVLCFRVLIVRLLVCLTRVKHY
jgi:hypothetical protein